MPDELLLSPMVFPQDLAAPSTWLDISTETARTGVLRRRGLPWLFAYMQSWIAYNLFLSSSEPTSTMSSAMESKTGKDAHVFHEYAPEDTQSPEHVAWRKNQAAVVRKLDCFIAPVMMLLMLISYLDRGNIGFAATQGMVKDIHLKGSQLNVCLHSVHWRSTNHGRSLFLSSTSSTSWQR